MITPGCASFCSNFTADMLIVPQDENRPACIRCAKAGYACLGYRETLFIDGKEQVLRRLGRKTTVQLEQFSPSPQAAGSRESYGNQIGEAEDELQASFRSFPATRILPLTSTCGIRNDNFMSYLVVNLHGPMRVMCSSLVMSNYQAESSSLIAMKQCFAALAMTFYGLCNGQKALMDDGRRQYLRALEMVNATLNEATNSGIKDALYSVFAICLHEVCQTYPSLDGSTNRLAYRL